MYDDHPGDQTICPHCGGNIELEAANLSSKGPINCYHCGKSFSTIAERTITVENTGRMNLEEILPVLKKGETVLLDNNEHPFHNEIALICDTKHKFYRLEIRGKKLWVPEHWVRKIDEPLADSD